MDKNFSASVKFRDANGKVITLDISQKESNRALCCKFTDENGDNYTDEEIIPSTLNQVRMLDNIHHQNDYEWVLDAPEEELYLKEVSADFDSNSDGLHTYIRSFSIEPDESEEEMHLAYYNMLKKSYRASRTVLAVLIAGGFTEKCLDELKIEESGSFRFTVNDKEFIAGPVKHIKDAAYDELVNNKQSWLDAVMYEDYEGSLVNYANEVAETLDESMNALGGSDEYKIVEIFGKEYAVCEL